MIEPIPSSPLRSSPQETTQQSLTMHTSKPRDTRVHTTTSLQDATRLTLQCIPFTKKHTAREEHPRYALFDRKAIHERRENESRQPRRENTGPTGRAATKWKRDRLEEDPKSLLSLYDGAHTSIHRLRMRRAAVFSWNARPESTPRSNSNEKTPNTWKELRGQRVFQEACSCMPPLNPPEHHL